MASDAGLSLCVAPLSAFEKATQRIDLLKIDVEGAELDVIKGGLDAITNSRPLIDIELHLFSYRNRLATLAEIFGLLKHLNYRFSSDSGEIADLSSLTSFENAHVYCEPLR